MDVLGKQGRDCMKVGSGERLEMILEELGAEGCLETSRFSSHLAFRIREGWPTSSQLVSINEAKIRRSKATLHTLKRSRYLEIIFDRKRYCCEQA